MKTHYALVSGVYDNYRVRATFETKASAEAALRIINAHIDSDDYRSGDYYRIESLPHYHHWDGVAMVTVHFWQQNFWDDGAISDTYRRSEDYFDFDLDHKMKPTPHVRFVRAPFHNNKGGRLEVTGTDVGSVGETFRDMGIRLEEYRKTKGKVGPQKNV